MRKKHSRTCPAAGRLFLILILLGVLCPALAADEPAGIASAGGDFELSWWKVASGGGASSGGDFVIEGTIGQHEVDPAQPASGGELSVIGGFWVAFFQAGELLPDFLFHDRFEAVKE